MCRELHDEILAASNRMDFQIGRNYAEKARVGKESGDGDAIAPTFVTS
jgi:hypothetical protein